MSSYSLLFSEMNIGNMRLKNRAVMAPMGVKSEPDGGVCERETDYYEARARGGCGLIITGRFAVTEKYEMRSHHLLSGYHHVGRLALLAERVHMHGAKLCVQIGPGLGRMVHQDPDNPPYSASAIPSFYYPQLLCRPYTAEDIRFLADAVGRGALLARTADADAVELHAYGGYLLDQFMSSQTNKRSDEYGGSLENRMRFTTECIEAIRKTCGPDFPVIVKYTPFHGIPGGRSLEEGIAMAELFEKAGADALHIDKGCFERWYDQISTVYEPHCHQLDIAGAVKKHVSIPIIAQGKLNDPSEAEQAIRDGRTDFAALGHQILADPEWPAKARLGKTGDIRPCIGCNECLYASHKGKIHSCAVNPLALREKDYPLRKAVRTEHVLVVGAGPAGIAAALTASACGHRVTIWEASSKPGGLLNAAGSPGFKRDVALYRDYLIRCLAGSDVRLEVNHTARSEEILSGGFTYVILANGSRPVIPPVPGADLPHVHTASGVLSNHIRLTGKTAVIGAGLVGCETALYIGETADQVSLIDIAPQILSTADHCMNNDQKLRSMMEELAPDLYLGAAVTGISEDEVEIRTDAGTSLVEADSVVFAVGFRADRTLEQELRGRIPLTVIGDAEKPRKIITAVNEGFHAGRLVESHAGRR